MISTAAPYTGVGHASVKLQVMAHASRAERHQSETTCSVASSLNQIDASCDTHILVALDRSRAGECKLADLQCDRHGGTLHWSTSRGQGRDPVLQSFALLTQNQCLPTSEVFDAGQRKTWGNLGVCDLTTSTHAPSPSHRIDFRLGTW